MDHFIIIFMMKGFILDSPSLPPGNGNFHLYFIFLLGSPDPDYPTDGVYGAWVWAAPTHPTAAVRNLCYFKSGRAKPDHTDPHLVSAYFPCPG